MANLLESSSGYRKKSAKSITLNQAFAHLVPTRKEKHDAGKEPSFYKA
jgi:hypothetical protein